MQGQDDSRLPAIEDRGARGCCFQIKVTPGARRNHVGGLQAGALKVSVTQVAERGKANQYVLTLLADSLQLKKNQLELISGETARVKKIACAGLSAEELRLKLLELVD